MSDHARPHTVENRTPRRFWHRGVLLPFWGNELLNIADLTFEDSAKSAQYVNIQPSDGVVAVIVQLSPLHFSPLAQLVLADTPFLDHVQQFYPDRTISLHLHHHPAIY